MLLCSTLEVPYGMYSAKSRLENAKLGIFAQLFGVNVNENGHKFPWFLWSP